MKHIYFTVTNDLNFDQRMQRICTSLATNGYTVTLVGRTLKTSLPLTVQKFKQLRLTCIFDKGVAFYAEYNFRLFFYLVFRRMDAVCAIDLDTIIPCLLVSKLKKIERIYDAHELFCEMKEVVSRPKVYKVWKWIERKTVPLFKWGYTVNEPIRDIFKKEYSVSYGVIRNLPLRTIETMPADKQTFIIYQGAVNHGRSFETLIPAFNHTDFPLHIYGDGNFLEEAKAITIKYQLSNKVLFKGKTLPTELKKITPSAILGITLFENNGLSNYYSLANRFFDYIQAGIPQLCVNYPAYKKINDEYDIAVLIEDLSPISIATAINDFLKSEEVQNKLRANCLKAREELNWQKEEKVLLHFYENLFSK